MSIFKKRTYENTRTSFNELNYIREKSIIKKLCNKIRRYKNARQYTYDEIISHFNPVTIYDYKNIINMLQSRLEQEIRIKRRLTNKHRAVRYTLLDPAYHTKPNIDDIHYTPDTAKFNLYHKSKRYI